METSEFDYNLPPEFIAQEPIFPRDSSKLMVLNRQSKTITHAHFSDLPTFLNQTDVLVFNESKVIPARLFGHKENGGKVELLLLRKNTNETWECLTKPGLKADQKIILSPALSASVLRVNDDGNRIISFTLHGTEFQNELHRIGSMPTPPYIKTKLKNQEWYQTVYAKTEGSAAAPTAGFHITNDLLEALDKKGVQKEFVTLHVGLDTFRPVRTDTLEAHEIHSEWCEVTPEVTQRLNEYKHNGRRIIAVGTTTVRTLESAAQNFMCVAPQNNTHVILNEVKNPSLYQEERAPSQMLGMTCQIRPYSDNTRLFIYPPYEFRFVDAMITNFHLPKSTLLALVSAFAGREYILSAYEEAKRNNYRFFSFGDGMLIL